MQVPGNMYFNIIQDCLFQLQERLNNQPDIKIELHMTISNQVMNLYEINMKQVRSMVEQKLITEEIAKEHEKKVEDQYKEKPNQEILYLRLDREAIVTEIHLPKEADFVPGFKYQRLIKGSWKDHTFPEKMEPPAEIDGTYRYIFKRRIKDLIYNNSAILKGKKKKDEADSRKFLYKAMLYDLVGIGLQVSASEFQQERMAKEKQMIQASQNEHTQTDLRAERGGKADGVTTGPTPEGEVLKVSQKIETISKERLDTEKNIPIDDKYKKEIAKLRKQAGLKDGDIPQA